MSDALESRSGQLQYRNLWSGADADRGTGGSDAAVDVQLPSGFFVPSADVASLRTHEGEINLFVWSYREKEPSFVSSGSRQGYNWMTWQSDDMRFCLISDASATDLRDLKDLMHP